MLVSLAFLVRTQSFDLLVSLSVVWSLLSIISRVMREDGLWFGRKGDKTGRMNAENEEIEYDEWRRAKFKLKLWNWVNRRFVMRLFWRLSEISSRLICLILLWVIMNGFALFAVIMFEAIFFGYYSYKFRRFVVLKLFILVHALLAHHRFELLSAIVYLPMQLILRTEEINAKIQELRFDIDAFYSRWFGLIDGISFKHCPNLARFILRPWLSWIMSVCLPFEISFDASVFAMKAVPFGFIRFASNYIILIITTVFVAFNNIECEICPNYDERYSQILGSNFGATLLVLGYCLNLLSIILLFYVSQGFKRMEGGRSGITVDRVIDDDSSRGISCSHSVLTLPCIEFHPQITNELMRQTISVCTFAA